MAKDKKKKGPTREERADKRNELAEFYQYEPFRGSHPISFIDAEIIEKLCDVLERTNAMGRLRALLEAWKVGMSDEDLAEELDTLLADLPATHEEALEQQYVHGPVALLAEVADMLQGPEKAKVAVIELQGDLLNVTSIHRLTKSSGYDTTLQVPTYLILVNKNLKQGDYLTSTFVYVYYTEDAREAEWERIKTALQEHKHVKFI